MSCLLIMFILLLNEPIIVTRGVYLMSILFGFTKNFNYDFGKDVFYPIQGNIGSFEYCCKKKAFLKKSLTDAISAYTEYLINNNLIPNISIDHSPYLERNKVDEKEYHMVRNLFYEIKSKVEHIDISEDSKDIKEECKEVTDAIERILSKVKDSECKNLKEYRDLTAKKEECLSKIKSFVSNRALYFSGIFVFLTSILSIPMFLDYNSILSLVCMFAIIPAFFFSGTVIFLYEKIFESKLRKSYIRAYNEAEMNIIKNMEEGQ